MFEQHCNLEEKSYRTHCMEAGSIRVKEMSVWLIEARYKCIWLQRISVFSLYFNLVFVGVFLFVCGVSCIYFLLLVSVFSAVLSLRDNIKESS